MLRLDVAQPLYVTGRDPAILRTLAGFYPMAGGPPATSCSAFDAAALASACVDAERSGDLGTVLAYRGMVRALSGSEVRPEQRRALAKQGRAEAEQNLALAKPSRRLLDDGTWVVDADRVRASWASTELSRAGLEKAFSNPTCVASSQNFEPLLQALVQGFGDPGPEFADPKQTLRRFQEAGWGAWLVALGRTWPNLIMATRDWARELFESSRHSGFVCVRMVAGRLEIETELPVELRQPH
jgi:hypothetical protein